MFHARFSRSRALIVAAVLAFAALARGQNNVPVSPADLPEAEFETLLEKTNLYVKALNAVSNAQRSYDRYASWVDVKRGPTGKERYITYGLYEISKSQVDDVKQAAQKGPLLKPALPELDGIIVRMSDAFSALEPIVKRAEDYYEQEDYKDDGAKAGQEMHAQMMPLFQQTFAAEAQLRRGLDTIKMQVDRRQLAQIEKKSGKGYEWHLRSFMLTAKSLINLLPESPEAPVIEAATYKERYAEVENAYNALEAYRSEHPDEMKRIIMASFVESAVKDFFAASKFLRRSLEGGKVEKREYVERVSQLAQKYNDLIQRTNTMR